MLVFLLIVLSFGNYAADTTTGIGDIAGVAGNQVNVAVKDRLPGGFTDVYSEIESLRIVFFFQDVATGKT